MTVGCPWLGSVRGPPSEPRHADWRHRGDPRCGALDRQPRDPPRRRRPRRPHPRQQSLDHLRAVVQGWRALQWQPHHYTVLFFHDEAVSLAAGHRPCALCRREDYDAYRDALAEHDHAKRLSAKEIDTRLHAERLVPRTRTRRLHEMRWADMPAGAFVMLDDAPHLVSAEGLVRWTTEGYADPRERPRQGTAAVLTPPASVAVLRTGYAPQVADLR